MNPHYALFFNGMKTEDLTQLKYSAVCDLNDGDVSRYHVEEAVGYVVDRTYIVRAVVPAMKSLEEILDVRAPRSETGEEPPSGDGPIQMFDILPEALGEVYGVDFMSKSLAGRAPREPYTMRGVKNTAVWRCCPTKEWHSHGYVKDWRPEYRIPNSQ